jgi:hypothetical protein
MSRTYTFYLAALVGAICIFFIVHAFFLGHFFVHSRTVHLDLMQGFLIRRACVRHGPSLRKDQGHEGQRLDHHVRIGRPGKFILWLRAYVPGAAILDGTYKVPPVAQAK